ncbi:hypothetical protein F4604DRAFT_1927427 [Suillus subluteus]|nr:hypothetical protein F4604DRAFT_1927427 [Suillus subluteus]
MSALILLLLLCLQPPAFLGPANRAHTRPSSSPVDGLSFLARRTSSSLSQRLFPFGKADVSLCCDREFPCSKRFVFTPPMSHKPKHKPPPSSKTQTKCSISLAARKNNSKGCVLLHPIAFYISLDNQIFRKVIITGLSINELTGAPSTTSIASLPPLKSSPNPTSAA